MSSEVQNCSFRLLHEFLLGSNCVLVDEQIRSPLVIACVWLAGKIQSETYRAYKLKRIISCFWKILEVLPEKLVAFLNLTHESPVVSLDSASAQTVTPTSANSTTPDTLDSSKLLENSIKSVENSILHFIQFDFGSVSVSPLSRLQSHSESSSSSQRPSTLIQSIGTLATQCNDSILEGSIRKCSNPAILFYPTSALYAPADIAASLIMITTRDKHMFDSSRGGRLAEMLGLDVSVARQICKELQRQSEVYVLKKDLVDSVFAVMGRRNRDPRSAQNIINEVSPALHNDYSQISFPPPSPPASSARSATLEIVNSRMSRSSSNHARNSKSNEQYSNRPNRRSRERSFDRNATFVEVQHRDSFTESYRRDDYDRHRGEQQSYINGGYNYWSRDTQRGYIDERHYDRHFQDHSRHPYFEDIRGSRDNFSRQESYGRENDGYRRNDDRHARNPMHRPDDYRRRDDRRDDYDDWEWERANPQPYGATYPAAASKSRR